MHRGRELSGSGLRLSGPHELRHMYEAPSFPESLELPGKLQVCLFLIQLIVCLQELFDAQSLWPLSELYCTVHCVQCLEKPFLSSRIKDFPTKHSIIQ